MQGTREFLATYGVIIQSVIQSFLKTPVCGASLSGIESARSYTPLVCIRADL